MAGEALAYCPLRLQAESCARNGAYSHCIILIDPVPADSDSSHQMMGLSLTIIHRLAAGKGDDAVVLHTRLIIWMQAWVSYTGPEGIGIADAKQ